MFNFLVTFQFLTSPYYHNPALLREGTPDTYFWFCTRKYKSILLLQWITESTYCILKIYFWSIFNLIPISLKVYLLTVFLIQLCNHWELEKTLILHHLNFCGNMWNIVYELCKFCIKNTNYFTNLNNLHNTRQHVYRLHSILLQDSKHQFITWLALQTFKIW